MGDHLEVSFLLLAVLNIISSKYHKIKGVFCLKSTSEFEQPSHVLCLGVAGSHTVYLLVAMAVLSDTPSKP